MIVKKGIKIELKKAILSCFFAIIGIFGLTAPIIGADYVYADPESNETSEIVETNSENGETEANVDGEANAEAGESTGAEESEPEQTTEAINEQNTETEQTTDETTEVVAPPVNKECQKSLGMIGWFVCPTTGVISGAVDFLYDRIENFLLINPIEAKDGSPIYEVWKYMKGITNIIFIIFLLVVVYSQLTGLGITNYGVKRALPKLIVAAILVNLSFLICSLAVDLSNVIGSSLRGVFSTIAETAIAHGVADSAGNITVDTKVSMASMYSAIGGGVALAVGGAMIAFESGLLWMLIPTVLGAVVAVVTGLITVALRQAVVVLLVMVAPLAIVANILPNTESLFKKWKDLLVRMLVFYPVFSLLFGASNLAGFAIIMSSGDGFGVLLGTAVQIFPLFFAWSLMKMSGTILGDINARLRGLAERPLAVNRAWADSRRQLTNARHLERSSSPYNVLRRKLDDRKYLRDLDLESLEKIRHGRRNLYAQKVISGGYDGTKTQGTKEYLKPNSYTKNAKDAMNLSLASETATMDTAHALSNYDRYYVSKSTRERVKRAEENHDTATLQHILNTDEDFRRSAMGAKYFLEYSRAQMTAENDNEADFNYMVSEFLDAANNKENGKLEKYRHYIESSAGGLGEVGQTRVLGKIIARAASVESNQRRDINIIGNKYPHMKNEFRCMLAGYYLDGDGYATDKDGVRLPEEKYPGYLLQHAPEKLVLWDKVDGENGPYYDWYDTNGKYVTRIYKKDGSAVKELLSNFDAPINDPINNVYGILAGIKPDGIEGSPFQYIGLDRYRTTIGRALMNAPFKEKNAAFSPMVKEMIARGYIGNYVHENIAYLDSLNKTTKPGAFNVQDGAAIRGLTAMMDPDQWADVFPLELVRTFRNIDGEYISFDREDADGNKYKVYANEKDGDEYVVSDEELMDKIKSKYIYPVAHKITMMMSKQTPNTVDNQKAGTVDDWKKLKEVFDKKWGEGKQVAEDPYKQNGDMRRISRDIQQKLYTDDGNGNRVNFGRNNRANMGGTMMGSSSHDSGTATLSNGAPNTHVNHHVMVDEMHVYSNGDPDAFARSFAEYCDNYPELARAKRDFNEFVIDRGYGVTEQELYEFAILLLDSYTNLD